MNIWGQSKTGPRSDTTPIANCGSRKKDSVLFLRFAVYEFTSIGGTLMITSATADSVQESLQQKARDSGGKAAEVSGTYTSANTAPYFLVAIPGQEIAVLGEE